jgi:hypothetical protein
MTDNRAPKRRRISGSLAKERARADRAEQRAAELAGHLQRAVAIADRAIAGLEEVRAEIAAYGKRADERYAALDDSIRFTMVEALERLRQVVQRRERLDRFRPARLDWLTDELRAKYLSLRKAGNSPGAARQLISDYLRMTTGETRSPESLRRYLKDARTQGLPDRRANTSKN